MLVQADGLLGSEAPAAQHSRLYEFHELPIGEVELLVTGREALPERLLSKLAIHCEPLLQDHAPFFGEVLDRAHGESGIMEKAAVTPGTLQGLGGDPSPHCFGLIRREGPVNDPIGEGEPSARSKEPERLSKRGSLVRQVQECFLADNHIEAAARQAGPCDIALDDPRLVPEADERGEFCCASNAARVQVDSDDMRSEAVRPISRWPTEPCTEIGNPSPLTNPGTFRQRLVRRETTVVVLVVRVEVLRLKANQVAPIRP